MPAIGATFSVATEYKILLMKKPSLLARTPPPAGTATEKQYFTISPEDYYDSSILPLAEIRHLLLFYISHLFIRMPAIISSRYRLAIYAGEIIQDFGQKAFFGRHWFDASRARD